MYKLADIGNKKIAIVDLLSEKNKLFWDLTDKSIQKYIKLWKKILFVVNRKWYSSSSICEDCGYIPKCKNCDIPIAKYVNNNQFVNMCPICKTVYENKWVCSNCWWTHIKEFWIWTYKLAWFLKNMYNINPKVLENTDLNSKNKIEKNKLDLKNEKYIISTSILSSESKYFKPDLVIFFNADSWLSIPDFNVWEKHFLFLYEFIKKYSTSNFIIQTFNQEHYVYENILKLDLQSFWNKELEYRKKLNYPPYSQLAVIIYKSQIEERLYRRISKLENELKYLIENQNFDITIFPTPQLVYKKFWKYHYNIVLKWKNVKSFLDIAVERLKIKERWFQVDWLPNNII